MAVSVEVRYHYPEIQGNLQSYDLRVEVIQATEMPVEIFVIQAGVAPARTDGAEATDSFICLADPGDIEEFPVNAPDLANDMPYYRVSDVTMRFRDMETLTETQTFLAQDIQKLVDSLKAAANFDPTEDVTYE